MDRRRRMLLIVGAAIAAVALIAFAGYWFLLRSDAPPPVSLESAVDAATSTTAAAAPTTAGGSTTTDDASAPTTTTTTAPQASAVDVSGTWASGGDSFVGYRVNEELANIGFVTAAGRTSDVTGTLSIDGMTVTEVVIEANLLTLQSDSSRRDGAIRQQALETQTFPLSSFRLTRPIELPAAAALGEPFEVAATGDFLLHGVTREVTIQLQAQLVDDTIAVVGSTEVLFADYDIAQPRAALVLSVEDRGIVEFQLLFQR